ncbi:MAG: hypothetical protein K6D03_04240 [Solobacterium sp.]|nr:hypothetical protein [Solobacterium sp.]
MNKVIEELLKGNCGSCVFPFFWQHGESEEKLRKMMVVIRNAGCRSVCIESRPHPDFCGEKWWQDMDIILDEARKRDMKIWILDDSHFPTGYANGKVKQAPAQLHRQSVASSFTKYSGKEKDITLNLTKLFPPKLSAGNFVAVTATKFMSKGAPVFDDDRILSVTAVSESGELTDIPFTNTGLARWHKPEGTYKVYVTGLSRNFGIHREYINMMSEESCRILIDEVYEKHYTHYKDDFGKTILGFFSDEPEIGNGFYQTGANRMGTGIDHPYSDELEEELKTRLGDSWKNQLVLLWNNDHPEKAARVRLEFMDAVTKLVRKDFSEQIGNWCHEHGVRYIGHLIEDNNSHSRSGMSLGHYFRGLNGQDMAGIDDIGGQVLPQGEDLKKKTLFGDRDGEFYHFALGNLAAGAAAVEPRKNGDSMCEIFGNYGWAEGVRLEKYLAEHFMVRGINHFVPHAFTGKDFPDPDCPPHFYAWGHNPQYRHFGAVAEYMNRVCTLISGGHRDSHTAVLYNGEFDWMGESMPVQKPLRKLYEAQIQADTIPLDVFFDKERYHTVIAEEKLIVNRQEYDVLVVPYTQFITSEMQEALAELTIPVLFIDRVPTVVGQKTFCDFRTVSLESLADTVRRIVKPSVKIEPANSYVRMLEYTNGNKIWYLVNEGSSTYRGKISLDPAGDYYEYDAWNNRICRFDSNEIVLEPSKGLIIINDSADESRLSEQVLPEGEKYQLTKFRRSVCEAVSYPSFIKEEDIILPDNYAEKDRLFSGFIRYSREIEAAEKKRAVLEITDAYEGTEVFVNGVSLGIQVVPPFVYDLSGHLKPGKNDLVIEIATTLERAMSKDIGSRIANLVVGNAFSPTAPTGISGEVNLYLSDLTDSTEKN